MQAANSKFSPIGTKMNLLDSPEVGTRQNTLLSFQKQDQLANAIQNNAK
jgi:hypothetical protein